MSVKISSWVWEHSAAKGNELLILLALADQADDAGICWPSVAAVAAKTRLSERTIQRGMRVLEDDGQLSIEERTGTSSRYTIHAFGTRPNPRQNDTPVNLSPVTAVSPRGDSAVTPGVSAVSPYTSLNHQETSLSSTDTREAVELDVPDDASENLTDLFDRFWQMYPRKTARQDAVKAYPKALKAHGGSIAFAATAINTAIRQHASHWRDVEQRPIDRIPYPASWLNGQRWTDELHDPPPVPPPPPRSMTNAERAIALANSIPEGPQHGHQADRAAVGQSIRHR